MPAQPKQVYLLMEDAVDEGPVAPLASYDHLWWALTQPLIWHWVVYDFLMTSFFTIVFTLLFNNFV